MGHKKRPSSSPCDAPRSTAPSFDAAKAEYEKASRALRGGNPTKALRIASDACAQNISSPIFHHILGTIHLHASTFYDTHSTKLRHISSGLDSARRALRLSPKSIEFARLYLSLLFEAATDSKDYDEVIEECQRVLSIPDPSDPAFECLVDDLNEKFPTAEARIAYIREEIKSLENESHNASILSWIKNLYRAEREEKRRCRSFPVFCFTLAVDPMEARLQEALRRADELENDSNTLEQLRKRIEMRVTDAKLYV